MPGFCPDSCCVQLHGSAWNDDRHKDNPDCRVTNDTLYRQLSKEIADWEGKRIPDVKQGANGEVQA